MEDVGREQSGYQTISGLEAVRGSLHVAESSMRAYVDSHAAEDRQAYNVAWSITAKRSADLGAGLPQTASADQLFKDLRSSKAASGKAVSGQGAQAAVSNTARLDDKIDQDINNLVLDLNKNLDQARRQRERDFAGTVICFICTMVLGTLSILLAAYGTGRQINQAQNETDDEAVYLDPETDALSREEFDRMISIQMQRAEKRRQSLSLLIIDIDQLPNIREQRGDRVYEGVLRTTAIVLMESFRTGDILGRFSETEFAVILQKTDIEGARIAAERARTAILNYEWMECCLTANFGAAQMEVTDDRQSLTARAERAVSQARRTGRNRVSLIHASTTVAA